MRKRIVVDRELCEANALCVRIAPMVFEIREDEELDEDVLVVKVEKPGEDHLARVERAVKRCPRSALSLEPLEPAKPEEQE